MNYGVEFVDGFWDFLGKFFCFLEQLVGCKGLDWGFVMDLFINVIIFERCFEYFFCVEFYFGWGISGEQFWFLFCRSFCVCDEC